MPPHSLDPPLIISFFGVTELQNSSNYKKKKDILRKTYPYICFVMTMYQALLMGTSVSTFLCTRKLGPEEVSVSLIAVYVHKPLNESKIIEQQLFYNL